MHNDPLNHIDPSGHVAVSGGVIGAISFIVFKTRNNAPVIQSPTRLAAAPGKGGAIAAQLNRAAAVRTRINNAE